MAERLIDTMPDIDAARTAICEAGELLHAARAAHVKASAAFERAIQRLVEDPLQATLECDAAPSDHRRAHRPDRPANIDADPELRAFILARIDRMTFHQLADAVAETFPPARRVRHSAIHAWWKRNRRL